MDTPENHTEQVQVENLRSSSDEDKTKTGNVAIGTDGTNEQQLDVMPAADTFLELSPEVRGGGNASQTDASPADPLIEFRIQRAGVSRDELDDEAMELMEILRDCIRNTHELTGFLAGHTEVIGRFQNDVSMLDAVSGFLAHILGPGGYGRVRPTVDQVRRRNEIRNRQFRAINGLRRIPFQTEEIDVAIQGGSGPVQEEHAHPVKEDQDGGENSM